MNISKELSEIFYKIETGENVNINNIDDILNLLFAILDQYAKDQTQKQNTNDYLNQLKDVSSKFYNHKTELSKFFVENMEDQLKNITLELQNINKLSEISANNILEATEDILTLIKNDSCLESKNDIKANLFTIIECCSFQDLNSQRIQKILKLMPLIYSILPIIPLLFNLTPIKLDKDQKLLNGPQSYQNSPKQKDIDDIFNNL